MSQHFLIFFILVVLCCISLVKCGETYRTFDLSRLGDEITDKFEDNGSVRIRREYQTPRQTFVTLEFETDQPLAILDFRITSNEPTRMSDVIFDGMLKGSVGGPANYYEVALTRELVEEGQHSIEIRFFDNDRAWRQFDNWSWSDDEDNDEPSFWFYFNLRVPTDAEKDAAIRRKEQASSSSQTLTP
mmetsp:Transcript_20166/g.29987  ORF Transcript_20166/g.29987 Transcript_20166/m.29987 type:complete len:187 (-) Transcript_20166:57-617(-)|eukprot:CAMPEP_0201550648 /NCGR_PEP_ID=MMETSP0173_2-20130828/6977_1 /ASSEMBLY_ACC=CAM_ASM_000268 /TAXON_ID=218659 /ORGANISM="Vexillifera sp., Strain DIVA3 564/2" /LENGTH=186 /DNA_ID=CAMNT_0047960685 /DNA_START=54 /DNA_END=614 /DNA_ORIENTATION=+